MVDNSEGWSMSMYERVRLSYQSASGQEINLTDWPFYWNESDLQAHAWEIESTDNPFGSKITRLRRGVTEKSVKLLIYNSGNSVKAFVDHLNAVFESDVVAKTPGKLLFNESYSSGYFTAASLSGRMRDIYTEYELTFTTDYPFWIEEETLALPIYSGMVAEMGLSFPTELPFGLVAEFGAQQFVNDHYAKTLAVISMFGPAEDPQIAVGSHIYKVNGVLGESERYEIDQRNRTVQKITQSGERINAFANRGKEYSVFEPIPSGESIIFHNGEFAAEIKLLKERSKPVWN